MAALALPTRRDEAWKWSDLRSALAGLEPPQGPGEDVITRLAAAAGAAREAVVSGRDDETSLVCLKSDGFEPGSEAIHVPAGRAYHRIVLQSGAGVALSRCAVRMEPGAVFRQFVLAQGGRLARIETLVEAGEGARVELSGVYICAAGRHADLTSRIVHAGPNGATAQLVKGAVRAGGRGVFQGKILVERAAQHTNARQYHHALLLEDRAEVFAKPELEIYADDVACAHGNTAGALDANALFYLRQRGVPAAQARALLTEAFLLEAVPDWLPPEIAEDAAALIRAWLEGGA